MVSPVWILINSTEMDDPVSRRCVSSVHQCFLTRQMLSKSRCRLQQLETCDVNDVTSLLAAGGGG